MGRERGKRLEALALRPLYQPREGSYWPSMESTSRSGVMVNVFSSL